MLKGKKETSSSLSKVRKFSCKNFLLDSSNPFGQTGEQAHFLTSSYTGDDTPLGAFGAWRWAVAPETHKLMELGKISKQKKQSILKENGGNKYWEENQQYP